MVESLSKAIQEIKMQPPPENILEAKSLPGEASDSFQGTFGYCRYVDAWQRWNVTTSSSTLEDKNYRTLDS